MDAHRRIKNPSQQLLRGGSAQPLVCSVGEGKGVQCGVPIAELVGGGKPRDAQRRSVRNSLGQLFFGGALPQRLKQRASDGSRLFAQHHRSQLLATLPPSVPSVPTAVQSRRQLLESLIKDLYQVHRVAPGVRLLHPGSTRVTSGQAS